MKTPTLLPPTVSLYEFCIKGELFGKFDPTNESWTGWNVLFKVLSGLTLTKKEQRFFGKVTGGLKYRKGKMPKNQCWIIGRGGGKSFGIGRIGTYRGLVFNKKLVPGQIPANLIMSPSMRASRPTIKYVEGLFEESDYLRECTVLTQEGKVAKTTDQVTEINLKNKCQIALMPTATKVGARGHSVWTLIMEEAAHFATEGQLSDEQVFDAALPGLARFGQDAAYYIITTPMTEEGLVWKTHKNYFGVENDEVLVVQAGAKEFNPTLDDVQLERWRKSRGEDWYQREIMARFVNAVNAAYSAESVNSCTLWGVSDLFPSQDWEYFGVLDPSGLSEDAEYNDEYAAAVAHVEERNGKGMVIVDAVRAWTNNKGAQRRVQPNVATGEAIELFRNYNISDVWSDRFLADHFRIKFEEAGFIFNRSDLSKEDLYKELLPCINDGSIQFVDDSVTTAQLKSLERKLGGNRDVIVKSKGKHDDRANVVALANYVGKQRMEAGSVAFAWV